MTATILAFKPPAPAPTINFFKDGECTALGIQHEHVVWAGPCRVRTLSVMQGRWRLYDACRLDDLGDWIVDTEVVGLNEVRQRFKRGIVAVPLTEPATLAMVFFI